MDIDQAAHAFSEAFSLTSAGNPKWWPRTQVDGTCLAWTLALTLDAKESGSSERYVCAAKGKAPARKEAILNHFGYAPWPIPVGKNGHINHEFLVDMSVCRTSEDPDEQLPLLAMESEMHARYDVHDQVDQTNGYSWDYTKLLWAPSAFRVFVARVGTRYDATMLDRRETLWRTLASLAEMYQKLWSGPLVAYILAEAQQDRAHSEVGVWTSGKFERATLSP